ncbi:MAG: YifB family Mg chelatase-like AAA ATPase [Lachnospiraceae bacterium]|nr:YifB family Mg chelatase-like AAA ATPase [Lachnospiraceae bacterium]
MYGNVRSASVYGIEAMLINVEADVSDGLPLFNMVGYLASEVKEAKDRVRTALKNSNFALRPKHITVNLSPADVRKAGTAFDLPIAMACLAASEILPQEKFDNMLIVGELSLDGKINRISGVLPICIAAKEAGIGTVAVPKGNAKEGAVVSGIRVIGVETLNELIEYILEVRDLEPETGGIEEELKNAAVFIREDFSEIAGQEAARRAAEIALSGQHNLLLSGRPGSGKTMIARRIPGIMPDMSFEDCLAVSKIYSVAGLLSDEQYLITRRPFRSPHHTCTITSLVGGGVTPKPGEISLAANGVLFLDEMPEFGRDAIEALRQPLEDRVVTVSRLNASYTYPAGFMLVASMNPCPCGHYPDRSRCTCSERQIRMYQRRISQPVMDRIDLCVSVSEIKYEELSTPKKGEDSRTIRERVMRAREVQLERYKGMSISFNAELTGSMTVEFCPLGREEKELMEKAFERYNLSARGYHRLLKVSRTIADMAGEKDIKVPHIMEALCYRDVNY